MATSKHYRNTVEIEGIEEGALWRRSGDQMILVDDDQFVSVTFDGEQFVEC